MTAHTSVATLHTNYGAININLFGNHAPKTVANFEGLATGTKDWIHPETGAKMQGTPLYNGVIFHRVIENFMIQGGDPSGNGTGGSGDEFDDEPHAELTFKDPYKLAMANRGIDRMTGKGTNGSQFFITVADTSWLWGKHTVFGEVADEVSRKVVDKIAALATDGRDRPLDDVIIESVTIEKA